MGIIIFLRKLFELTTEQLVAVVINTPVFDIQLSFYL